MKQKIGKGKIRDERYLNEVREMGCLVCGTSPVNAHHLMNVDDSKEQQRGIGLRNGDDLAVPLCPKHHDELHRFGRERTWWAIQGTDPVEWAKLNWRKYDERRSQN